LRIKSELLEPSGAHHSDRGDDLDAGAFETLV
jgi:hypothetical protein